MALFLPAAERIVTHPPFWTQRWAHDWDEVLVPIQHVYRVELDGGDTLSCRPGEGLFLPAGTGHLPLAKVGDPLVFFCCMWQPREPQDGRRPGLVDDGAGHLLHLCAWMERLTTRQQRTPAVARRLQRLADLVADLVGNRLDPAPVADERVARVIDYLAYNLAEQNRVPDLAARVGLSPDGFIKRFRAATGTTPGRYLQDLRLERALALLSSTDLTLAEIAERVGYATASHLCQLVKRRTGRLAGSFR